MGGHSHHHDHSHRSFNKAFAIAVTLTLLYCVLEAIYGLLANSMSLLADAAHNFGDALGLILAWIANWFLSFPARKRYSYGFKRLSIIAALINAFILVATSALIAYESIYKLLNLTAVNESVVIIIGLLGILVNAGCSLLFMRGAREDLNIKSAFWHLLADALILVGVVLSAILITYSGWQWIDPLLGLVIVGIVLFGTWELLRESLSLMMDGIPHYIDQAGVQQFLKNYPGVETIHDLHIWGLSTREVAMTVHLVMPKQPLTDADYKKINDIMHHTYHINHVTIQVESGSDAHCLRTEKC